MPRGTILNRPNRVQPGLSFATQLPQCFEPIATKCSRIWRLLLRLANYKATVPKTGARQRTAKALRSADKIDDTAVNLSKTSEDGPSFPLQQASTDRRYLYAPPAPGGQCDPNAAGCARCAERGRYRRWMGCLGAKLMRSILALSSSTSKSANRPVKASCVRLRRQLATMHPIYLALDEGKVVNCWSDRGRWFSELVDLTGAALNHGHNRGLDWQSTVMSASPRAIRPTILSATRAA
jgi:hypothetical protein